MNTQLANFKQVAIFLVGIFAASIPAVAHADWSIMGLGTLDGESTTASGINDSGQVAGYSFFSSITTPLHAFITGPNGVGMTDLGTFKGEGTITRGINDSGQVVGYNDSGRSFITGPNGIGLTDLGTLGGDWSWAFDINDAGEVVGFAATAHGEYHAFIFSHGGMTDLSLLAPVVAAGWTNIVVNSINNNGQMVGFGRHLGHEEAFLLSYTPDTIFDPQPIYIPPVPEPETYVMLLVGLCLIGYRVRRGEEATI